jgi:hypothetical protein
VAGALALGLATPVAALLPIPDEASYDRPEPMPVPDDGYWQPAPSPEPPESAPAEPPAPEPQPSYQPGGGYGTEYDTGTEYNVPATESDASSGTVPPAPEPGATAEEQGQISEEEATRQTEAALNEAVRLMKLFNDCKWLIGTSEPEIGPPVYPWDRLEELRRDTRVADTYQMAGPDGTPARIGPLDRPGVLPVLQIFQEFHANPSRELLYRSFGDGQNRPMVDYMFESLGGTITPDEFRALVILHELAHLTGALGDHGSPANYAVGWKFSSDVFTKCIRGDRKPTEPAPTRRDDDESVNDGLPDTDDGFWGLDPSGNPGDPGESEDPQGFDTDLTIRGGDGSVVEGGNVGDPNLEEPNYDDPCDPFYDSNPNGLCGSDPGGYGEPDPGEPYDPGYGGGDWGGGDDWGGGGGGGDIARGDEGCGYWDFEDCSAYYLLY